MLNLALAVFFMRRLLGRHHIIDAALRRNIA
jgi:hypothetical protein